MIVVVFRLTRDSSKQLLNALVVDVAVCKTVELLGRWLNEFIAQVEPDQTNERLRRCFEDRYVSIRPDIDGISFLNAAIASADADAINQVLNALAAIAEPGDTRTFQQRRADACTELLLGKISNGCHVSWQDDDDDDDDDEDDEDERRTSRRRRQPTDGRTTRRTRRHRTTPTSTPTPVDRRRPTEPIRTPTSRRHRPVSRSRRRATTADPDADDRHSDRRQQRQRRT